jgi:hypothetical protein
VRGRPATGVAAASGGFFTFPQRCCFSSRNSSAVHLFTALSLGRAAVVLLGHLQVMVRCHLGRVANTLVNHVQRPAVIIFNIPQRPKRHGAALASMAWLKRASTHGGLAMPEEIPLAVLIQAYYR